jgi:small-conductance mechanosensitive channel
MRLDEIIKTRLSKGKDNHLVYEHLPRLSKFQTNIIIACVVALAILSTIQFMASLNIILIHESIMQTVSKLIIAVSGIIVVAAFLKITSPIMNRFFYFLDVESRNILLKTWNYAIWVIFAIFALAQFTGQITSLGLSIGVFSAGLAIALQQPIVSIVGWFVIISRRMYTVGDRITVKGIRGDVHDITLFHTSLLQVLREKGFDQPTGVMVNIPNSIMLTEPVLNDTIDFPYVWDYLEVGVTYESDIELSKKIMLDETIKTVGDQMKKAAERMRPYFYGTSQEADLTGEPTLYTNLNDSSITLTVRYICRATKRWQIKSEITTKILETINKPENKNKVKIAYPHMEIVYKNRENP